MISDKIRNKYIYCPKEKNYKSSSFCEICNYCKVNKLDFIVCTYSKYSKY